MRKIEQRMVEAVEQKRDFESGNTKVVYFPAIESDVQSRLETSRVYLHGNHIATKVHSTNRTTANVQTLCYPTNTTKSRLRALGLNVKTVKGITYLKEVC